MARFYIDPGADSGMPEIEIWPDLTLSARCKHCGEFEGAEGVLNADDDVRCPSCSRRAKITKISCDYQYYYWFCVPGRPPDSDCFGPYPSEREALEAARSFRDIA